MKRSTLFAVVPLALVSAFSMGQDRLATMPRYQRFEQKRQVLFSSVHRNDIVPAWSQDGKSFGYASGGKYYKFDLATLTATESKPEIQNNNNGNGGRRQGRRNPDRGRQFSEVFSADGKLKAFYRDRNVWLSDADGKNERQITTDGSVASRIKNGQASWVYGEELGVREAMWFSADGKKLVFYRFDESKVPDYFLAMNQISIQDVLDVEAYPKAGAPNPSVDLVIYDLADHTQKMADVRFANADLGHYVYDVRWSPDGSELLFNRTNRKQNVMEVCACNPTTGACRTVVHEEWLPSWVENHPQIQWLEDKPGKPREFLILSERTGFKNIFRGDMSGSPLQPITHNNFEMGNIVRVDEGRGVIYYTGRDGENPYKIQLHRIRMDGTGDTRLTDPAFSHSTNVSPDGKFIVDNAEKIDVPPVSRLLDANGKVLKELSKADITEFEEQGFKKVERLKFKAADGVTDIYGYAMYPSDFDPSKKYPLVVECYGGPETGNTTERFSLPSAYTELGFIMAWFDNRGTNGRGKAFMDAVYGKLGVTEIDDQAAGVKYLAQRPYVDGNHVGICGTSYGGYTSVMCILRHPEAFQVSVAGSPVTDWRNYDSIYTERFMGLPDANENAKGYEAGSAMTYASNLKGHLMLYYGTADNNVHPSNTFQLVHALESIGKSYDLQVGPDQGHSAINTNRQWEYFIDYLILGR